MRRSTRIRILQVFYAFLLAGSEVSAVYAQTHSKRQEKVDIIRKLLIDTVKQTKKPLLLQRLEVLANIIS